MRSIDELDHYELLEINRSATPSEIDRAYRVAQQTYAEGSLALYSVFERSDAASIRLSFDEAYRVLSDAELRAKYDAELPAEAETQAAARPGAASTGAAATSEVDGPMDAAQGLSGFDPVEQFRDPYQDLDPVTDHHEAVVIGRDPSVFAQ